MAIPKGKLVTPVAFDPDGNLAALEVDAAGNLKVTGGDGVSTFVALTDTPDSFADQAKKRLAVNAGENALEFVSPVMITTAKARAYAAADQLNIVHATPTKVVLDLENYDTSDAFANSRFTVKEAGYYLVVGRVSYIGVSVVANKVYNAGVYLNGVMCGWDVKQSSVVDLVSPSFLDIIYLDIDDYLELFAYHFAGVNTVDIYGRTDLTFLAIHFLSAD